MCAHSLHHGLPEGAGLSAACAARCVAGGNHAVCVGRLQPGVWQMAGFVCVGRLQPSVWQVARCICVTAAAACVAGSRVEGVLCLYREHAGHNNRFVFFEGCSGMFWLEVHANWCAAVTRDQKSAANRRRSRHCCPLSYSADRLLYTIYNWCNVLCSSFRQHDLDFLHCCACSCLHSHVCVARQIRHHHCQQILAAAVSRRCMTARTAALHLEYVDSLQCQGCCVVLVLE